eukprot:CAMPEP_0168742696 /NCGR_PEP_ID=MMETSP0724-20121128/13170_1 /TAXON_ID=265536 /ORGANISM="Amphiprora sp., Strain CCMP467" /LENGTH=76 /DNA_ID=CAMNT_0008790255 /DNA_START=520 /DNA_END=747 /DNA_ORIENTATION=-
MLHGLAVGHIYYFLVAVLPLQTHRQLLQTPQLLIDVFHGGDELEAVQELEEDSDDEEDVSDDEDDEDDTQQMEQEQ